MAKQDYWRRIPTMMRLHRSQQLGVDLNRNHGFKWGGAGTNPCEDTYRGQARYQSRKPRPSRILL